MKSEVTIGKKDLIYAFTVALVINAAEDMKEGNVKKAAGNAMINNVLESGVVKELFPNDKDEPVTLDKDALCRAFASTVSDITHDAREAGASGLGSLLVMFMSARVNKRVYDELFKDDEEEESDDPEKALADAIAGDSDEAEH